MNKKINVGVVGLHFGHEIITDHLIGGEAAPYFRLAAVCDRIQDKADAIAARYGVSACYDVADMLANPEIEAICLMIGPAGRARIIDRILESATVINLKGAKSHRTRKLKAIGDQTTEQAGEY